jgi:hypothetical protein
LARDAARPTVLSNIKVEGAALVLAASACDVASPIAIVEQAAPT